jgi:predicted DNA-binding transcriptional regulator AlpA
MYDQGPLSLNVHLSAASSARLEGHIRGLLEAELDKVVAKIQARMPSVPPSEPKPTSSPKSTGLDLKEEDRAKAADLRIAFLLGKVPEDSGLLVSVKTLAKLLDVSQATLHRLNAQEAIPSPVQIGHLKKWRLAEILEWIEADCPPLRVWTLKRQKRK